MTALLFFISTYYFFSSILRFLAKRGRQVCIYIWSYGSCIYNYLYNQCLPPLMLWIRISIRARCTTLCDKVSLWLPTGRWFIPGLPVSSINKTDRHDLTEILLKVALTQSNKQANNKLCNNFEQDYYINTLNVKTCLSYNFKPQSGQIKDYKAVLLGIKIMCPSRGVSVVVFNATFNNISVTLWWSVLLREEKRKPVLTQVTDNNVVSSTHFLSGMRTHNVSGYMHWLHR